MTRQQRSPTGRTLPLGWDGHDSAAPSSGTTSGSAGGPRSGPTSGPTVAETGTPVGGSTDAPRPRRRGLGIVAVVVLVLALVLVLPRVLLGGGEPEDPVREYLDALVAAEASTVREHLAATEGSSDAAITEEVLRETPDRISGYTVDAVSSDGRQATVETTVEMGTTARTASFTVHAESVSSFTPSRWVLDPVTVSEVMVRVPEGAEQILVNGVAVAVEYLPMSAVGDGQQMAALRLMPGSYDLSLPARGDLLTAVTEQIEVPVQAEDPLLDMATLGHDLSPAGLDLVLAQIGEALESCAQSTAPDLPDCHLSVTDEDPQGASGVDPVPEGAQGTWEITAPEGLMSVGRRGETVIVATDVGEAVFTPEPSTAGGDEEPRRLSFMASVMTTPVGQDELSTEIVHLRTVDTLDCEADGITVRYEAQSGEGQFVPVCVVEP